MSSVSVLQIYWWHIMCACFLASCVCVCVCLLFTNICCHTKQCLCRSTAMYSHHKTLQYEGDGHCNNEMQYFNVTRLWQFKVVDLGVGRVSRPRRVEVIQTCIKLRNDDCHYLYPSPDINEMTEWRKIRWVGYRACTGKGRNA